MKNLFKSYPTQSHLIPLNPTIISSLLYIYIIRYHISSADLIFIFNHGSETEVNVDDHSFQIAAHGTLKIEKNTGVTSVHFTQTQAKSCYVIELIQR